MDLINKPDRDCPMPKPWEERPVSKARWRAHRDALMNAAYPGTRPTEWWVYEQKMEKPKNQAAALLEMGQLYTGEQDVLLPLWQDAFDRAWESGFCFYAGQGLWLEGVRARKAWYRMHGIPPVIVKRFADARRRAARFVRGLRQASMMEI